MIEDAVGEEMRIPVLVDAAKILTEVGVWVGIKRRNSGWSYSYLFGRCILTAEDATAPKDELNALIC